MQALMPRRPKKLPMSAINVVPYIDVMLVLLIIFMITAPLLSEGVKVSLPQAAAKAITKQQHEPVIITVNRKGLYYLNIGDHPKNQWMQQLWCLELLRLNDSGKTPCRYWCVVTVGQNTVML